MEKAEILQMTVDHLKMLHTAGGKGKMGFFYLAWEGRKMDHYMLQRIIN